MSNYDLLKDIPHFLEWTKIELVNKGWSEDKKFRITDKSDNSFLLRTANAKYYDRKKAEYEIISIISKLDIPMSMPIDFGVFDNNEKVYSLLSWVDGEDAEIILPKLNEELQYKLGVKAGQLLRKMHSVAAPSDDESWSEFYKRKIQRKIDDYRHCRINIHGDDKIINFIKSNISYLDGRPKTFQHGDYHVGNLIITPNCEIGVIDFNRFGFGDPWEEYDRYVFTWQVSVPFAIGQIHGYFDNKVPDVFFRLMSLYNAINIIASIPWAIPFGNTEIRTMLTNAEKIFSCYNGFETYIPRWYKEPTKESIF